MACVDQTNDHNLYVFELSSGSQVYKHAGGAHKIYDCAFDRRPGSTTLSTCGTKHIKFWETIGQDKQNNGILDGNPMTSHSVVCFDEEGIAYSGAHNGQVYKWEERKCVGTFTGAKSGFVSAIRALDGKLYAGGKCGTVTCFSIPDMAVETTVQFDSMIRAIDCLDGAMLIGTRNGSIYHCNQGSRKEIMSSHHDGEVWGLDHQGDKVITSGDDNQVICWDTTKRCKTSKVIVSDEKRSSKKGKASTLSHMPASQCSRAVIFCENGGVIVAANDGRVHIWDKCTDTAPSKTLDDAEEWIECMSLSPNKDKLAVGSHDNSIYIYSTADWTLLGKLSKHTSYIMALDWCAHGKFIRSNCGAYELLFFDVDTFS